MNQPQSGILEPLARPLPGPGAVERQPPAAPTPPAAIHAEGLTKTYKGGTQALCGVDLEVRPGEVFCLLGPNGAGKTTLTRILATQLAATAGTARVFGLDIDRQVREVRHLLSVVPQQSYPDFQLKVWEHILYYLVARGMSWREGKEATRAVVEQLGLADKYDALVQSLSGGMRRRVLLCMAIATRARLMLLDEPTAGLDVLTRRDVWKSLTASKAERTVLLTTHSLEEAEALADRIGIMGDGKLVASGTLAELRRLAPGPQKVVFDEGALPREQLERYGYLQEYAGKWAIFPPDREALQGLLDEAVAAGAETSLLHTSLEDVFVYLVGDQRRKLKIGELR
ncbi:MAG TPA: ABC transporter ATP-binding protein [Longimicrobiaceae bacterium]